MKISWGIVVLLAMVGCGQVKQPASTPAPTDPGSSPTGPVIAMFNGQPITDADIRKSSGGRFLQAEAQFYEARVEGIESYIDDKLLDQEASKRGVTRQELLSKEITDKVKIEDKELQKVYNEKKSQFGGKKFEEVKNNLRAMLYREKYQKRHEEVMKGLKKSSKIEVLIAAPKVTIEEGDAPAMGPKGAPIQLVEFTDYQCPFCGRARPAINQILETYKGKVRYLVKDFPLSFHKEALKAHEAAHCAGEAGKYFEMNQKIWDNQKQIKVEDLKGYAKDLKLNVAKFDECLDSGKFAEKVRLGQAEGEAVGVTGTPAFFVNGRMLSGARPFEAFKTIIDDELKK